MPTSTTNLGLKLPEDSDFYDIRVLNGNFEKIDDMFGNKSDPLTLAPGTSTVTVEHDTPFILESITGRTELRDGVGIVNVKNPYAIVTGGNLLPITYDFVNNVNRATITGEYTFEFLAKLATDNIGLFYDLEVEPNKTYYVRTECSNPIGTVRFEYYKDMASAGRIENFLKPRTYHKANEHNYVAMPPNCGCVRIYISNEQENEVFATGEYRFSNFIMVQSEVPKEFRPQQRSMFAVGCELMSNPIDGTKADMLYVGDDGQPYVRKLWDKVSIDTDIIQAEGIGFVQTGFKVLPLRLKDLSLLFNKSTRHMTKYTGLPLTHLDVAASANFTAPDQFFVNNSDLRITVRNSETGFGESYNPSPEEVAAFILGWRINTFDNGYNSLFNGTGIREWHKIDSATGEPIPNTGIRTLPTATHDKWKKYQLQYLKAIPITEPVANYEFGATLCAGSNQVKVGSGIVLREHVIPKQGGDNKYYLHSRVHYSQPKHLVKNILQTYRNNKEDHNWNYYNSNVYTDYGIRNGECLTPNFDTSAVYNFTYFMLDPTLSRPLVSKLSTNLRGTLTDTVQNVADLQKQMSVLSNQKSDKDAPQWIWPTLLNGWVVDITVGYYKDSSGIVRFAGNIKNGTNGSIAFKLPDGYRPDRITQTPAASYTGSTWSPCVISIDVDGSVYIDNSGTPVKITLSGVSFLAK